MIKNKKYSLFTNYTDRELVEGILSNNVSIIEYLFFYKYSSLFGYIVHSVFDGKVDTNELISELYLYLASNNWHKVRLFDFRSKFSTWLSVVAVRFFQKKREELIEKKTDETLCEENTEAMISNLSIDRKMDVHKAINSITNERYRMVIVKLDFKDMEPEEVAKSMNITVDNLYNIHRRALLHLRLIMKRKEDYYD